MVANAFPRIQETVTGRALQIRADQMSDEKENLK